jgi:hypothetical protein
MIRDRKNKEGYMKRALIAAGIAAMIFGGVYGLAASLSVSSSSLGAGTATVAGCQTTGTITTTYAPAYSASLPGYDAVDVTLGAIHADCLGKSYKVRLTDASNVALGSEATGSIAGTSASLTFTGVSAASVEKIFVTIYG